TVAVGDFNGDGRLDLVVTNSHFTTGGALPGNVSVLLGNGDGTFQTARTLDVGITPAFVTVRDFNGDGKADLAVANFTSNTVSVLLGNGDSTCQPARTLTVNKAGTGSGTVTASPPGIDCGATCSASYNSGTRVFLTATPDGGSTFTGWTGCDAVSGTSCTVTMSAARSVTATFTPTMQSFTLTA